MERDLNPMPNKLICWTDIARGIGEVVFHTLFDHLKSEGKSDHFKKEFHAREWQSFDLQADVNKQLHIPFDSEGNWHNVE